MSDPTAAALAKVMPNRALSQFNTPQWLSRRMASWCWRGARILEPCAGRGSLIAALIEAGHEPRNLIAIEKDPECAAFLSERFAGVSVTCGDFLELPSAPRVDLVCMNPPYEGNQQMHFALKALETAREVVLLAPTNIEFSLTRDEEMWRTKALVARRARLPVRPKFGGPHTPSFDSVVLKLKRRDEPRRDDEIAQVSEEIWRP